ncbi:class I SAM-dependent methyltransferase [Polynucleobacter paneuropaeus]|nr:class I SAM-dependent methyltransferase [Polynucleobacter paneuropaeus]
MKNKADYVGTELELFSKAKNWRSYWVSKVKPSFGRCVLEVGAGIGTVTKFCCDNSFKKWVALEPDSHMIEMLYNDRELGLLPEICDVRHGDLTAIRDTEIFDTIIYIDVLEHIEDDRGELCKAYDLLAPNGFIIVLVPAYQFLYSSFDASVGHYRRYSKKKLLEISPIDMSIVACYHLDSVGLCASIVNKIFLKQSNPTLKQILFWDRFLVCLSKILDPLIHNFFGKSLLVIWKKPENSLITDANNI